jgi:hypothetical protein
LRLRGVRCGVVCERRGGGIGGGFRHSILSGDSALGPVVGPGVVVRLQVVRVDRHGLRQDAANSQSSSRV